MRRKKGFSPLQSEIPRGRNGSYHRAFTLIEMLIVISIVALLLAILLPALTRVRRQARSTACRANLHQWGLMFEMYTSTNDSKFFQPTYGDTWIEPMRPYYENSKDSLLLCPMATRHYVEDPNAMPSDPSIDSVIKKRFWAMAYVGGGTKFHAWLLFEPEPFCSYGMNDWVMDQPISTSGVDSMWRTPDVKLSCNVPVFLDCVWRGSRPHHLDSPPPNDDDPPKVPLGANQKYSAMQYFCMDRHNGFINGLFMDWSVRKIGLKELWTLKWHRYFPTNGIWTKAGGAEPADWPDWIKKYKAY